MLSHSFVLPAVAVTLFSAHQQPNASTQIAAPTELRVTGDVTTPLALSESDLKNMPRQTLKVVNPHEKKEEEGVAVRDLLHRAGVPQNDKLRGAAMASYVVAEASDGYRVVYSLAKPLAPEARER